MLRDLFVEAIAAVLGAVVVGFFLSLRETNPVLATAGVILTAISVVLVVSLGRDLKSMLIPAGSDLQIAGTWSTNWSYNREKHLVKISDTVDLHQIGCFVWGTGSSHSVTGPTRHASFRYRVQGRVSKDRLFEGEWRNLNKGRGFRGSFQLRMRRNGVELEGQWLGITEDLPQSGHWCWWKQK